MGRDLFADPLTIAYLIDPTVLTTKAMFTEIDIRSVQATAVRISDFFGYFKREPNSNVAVEVDVEKFWDIIEQGNPQLRLIWLMGDEMPQPCLTERSWKL